LTDTEARVDIVYPGALLATATANKKTVDADAVQQALLDQEAS
jgi:hypothetical protein